MTSWVDRYGINVSDLGRTVAFYETLGLECTSGLDSPGAPAAVVAHPGKGSTLQLTQQAAPDGTIDRGDAFWKLYVNTNDIAQLHDRAVDAGHRSIMAPTRLDRWPITIGFVADPDGHQVELAQRHPWTDGDDTTLSWLGQCCINVSDLERAVGRYEALGLECTSRTEIPQAFEAIVENPAQGSKLQLAQQKEQDGPVTMGAAMGMLSIGTDDVHALHRAAIDAGLVSLAPPQRLDHGLATTALVGDPDGYQLELVQRHP